MEKLNKSIGIYVSYLRALYFLHQQHHWIASGPNFYALHLMFEKLYKSAEHDADEASEKFVSLFGDECLDTKAQIELQYQVLTSMDDDDNIVSKSLALEEKFLAYSKNFFSILKEEHEKEMTDGLDDMIMGIANNRESACYHLKRTLHEEK